MAESSERALTPDEASYVAAARDKAFVLEVCRFAASRPAIIPLEEP
jgi:hypothetical protein